MANKRSLREIWTDLLAETRVTDRPAGEDLSGGARITASIGIESEIVLGIWRFGAPVGIIEERTFKDKCGVPEWAWRAPLADQFVIPARDNSGQWHYIAYHWHEEGYQGE